MHPITERIDRLRREQGLSLTNLAEAAAIPRQTLGRRLVDAEDFTIKELDRIAGALGTTSLALMLGDAA